MPIGTLLLSEVTAYLDESLDLDTRARFDEHLLDCDGCDNYLQQFRSTIGTVGRIPDDEIAPEFRTRLLDAFKDWRV